MNRNKRVEALAGHYERKALREAGYAERYQSIWYQDEALEAEAIANAYRAGLALRARDILPIRKLVEAIWEIEDGLWFLIDLTLGGNRDDIDEDLDLAEDEEYMAS